MHADRFRGFSESSSYFVLRRQQAYAGLLVVDEAMWLGFSRVLQTVELQLNPLAMLRHRFSPQTSSFD